MALKASGRGRIPPFMVMDVLAEANALAAGGAEILHLEVGQPSTGAPPPVLAAATAILASDRLGYTESLGLPALRAALAAFHAERYGHAMTPERIVVTTGSSAGFLLAFLAAFDAGDRVAYACPGYPGYPNILKALGLEPVPLRAGPDSGFRLDVGQLEALKSPPDGLILASPANPTGTMLTAESLVRILDWCRAHGVRVISDEIYHGITFDTEARSVVSEEPEAIVLNGFSKYFSMTGWRLGWMVLPPSLIRPVECLAQNFFIAPPSLAQHAALAVFGCRETLDAHVDRYRKNRDDLIKALAACGFGPLAPAEGGFYVYAGLGTLTKGAKGTKHDEDVEDSESLCRRLLRDLGIAATPGTDFDPWEGRRFIRFSCAGSREEMARATRRLHDWALSREDRGQG